jgi:hypothetical protein
MRNCRALGVTLGNLEGAIIYLEEHRTLHSNAGYQSTLKLLQEELATAAKAYFECMNGSQ